LIRRASISLLVLSILAALAIGCRKKSNAAQAARATPIDGGLIDPGQPVPSGDVHDAHFRFAMAIYHMPRARRDPLAELRQALRTRPLQLRTEVPKDPPESPVVVLLRPSIEKFAPPDLESLRYSGKHLSDAEKGELQSSREATLLLFAGPISQAETTYKHAIELSAALAQRTGGLLWDDEMREAYSTKAWLERIEANAIGDVRKHIVIHMYRDVELIRLVSLGMGEFGLPDVTVNQVAGHDSNAMGNLVNLTCQALYEQGTVGPASTLDVSIDAIRNPSAKASLGQDPKKGATGKATLQLAIGERQEGDSDNRLIEIVFPGPKLELQVRQNALLSQIFGADDTPVGVRPDEELKAASARARAKAIAMKSRFRKGVPELERFLVKAPFHTAGGSTEYMWIELVSWEGKTIAGILENDPADVPELKAGARVEVQEDVVFDYIYRHADGTSEGNETSRLIEKMNR
jgi:uncharacterized protein YegJ (DUF2314 family)